MQRRQVFACTVCVLAASMPILGYAQSSNTEAEAAVRKAVAGYIATWNSHDVAAWADWLADDIEWVEPDGNVKKSKEAVAGYISYYVPRWKLDLKIKKLALSSSGKSATVVLEGKWLWLEAKNDVREYPRDPLLWRLRLDGDRWRLSYINQSVVSSAEIAKAEGL